MICWNAKQANFATSNKWFFTTSNLCNMEQMNFATSSEWFFATSNFCSEKQAKLTTSNDWIFAMTNFYNESWANFATSNKWFLQGTTSATSNEPVLRRLTCKFGNKQRVVLQGVTNSEWISTSKEQQVKRYTSMIIYLSSFYKA